MKTSILTLMIAMFVTGQCFAQGFMPWTDVMMMADANEDGALTMDEVRGFSAIDHFIGFMPFIVDHFKDCDSNSDGMLNMFELKKCTKSMGMTDDETSRVFYKGLGFMPRANQ